uniref:CAZy families GH1 protein n=1 Tax=uncultured Bacillus sp. TaxID=83428 RepID=A0A060C2I8_9BACI|nr:CAZy families GH1 protein [uncultured Bacillus sp.]
MYVMVSSVITSEYGPANPVAGQQGNHNMMVAQARVMKMCHEMTEAKIGPAPNIALSYAASTKPEDVNCCSKL